jgi:hypothetical protein
VFLLTTDMVLLGLNTARVDTGRVALNAILGMAILAYTGAGRLITSRRPGNAVGWLLGLIGVTIATSTFAEQYALYGLATARGSVPGARSVGALAGAAAEATSPTPRPTDDCGNVTDLPDRLPFPRGDRVSRTGCVYPRSPLAGPGATSPTERQAASKLTQAVAYLRSAAPARAARSCTVSVRHLAGQCMAGRAALAPRLRAASLLGPYAVTPYWGHSGQPIMIGAGFGQIASISGP